MRYKSIFLITFLIHICLTCLNIAMMLAFTWQYYTETRGFIINWIFHILFPVHLIYAKYSKTGIPINIFTLGAGALFYATLITGGLFLFCKFYKRNLKKTHFVGFLVVMGAALFAILMVYSFFAVQDSIEKNNETTHPHPVLIQVKITK